MPYTSSNGIKELLDTGCIVQLRNGTLYYVSSIQGVKCIKSENSFISLQDYTCDLKFKNKTRSSHDVVGIAVYLTEFECRKAYFIGSKISFNYVINQVTKRYMTRDEVMKFIDKNPKIAVSWRAANKSSSMSPYYYDYTSPINEYYYYECIGFNRKLSEAKQFIIEEEL